MFLLQASQPAFWKIVQPFDAWLIKKINNDWSNSLLDKILPFLRETSFWMPLYIFMFFFIILNFGRKGWWWSLTVVLIAAISDIISSQLIKETIFRVRPCRDEEVSSMIRFFVNYCPRSSSFTSSHATTHFAQAIFFYFTLRQTSKWWGLIFVWAFAIAYTQVYVGVHYPFDVFCGALLGCVIGWTMSKAFHKQIGTLI